MKENVVEVLNVSVVYDSATAQTHALEEVSLTISAGQFVSLVGPSGCGKTTLLRSVAGLIKVNKGKVLVVGKTPAEARCSRELGFVFQEPALLEWRTALENVILPLEIAGVSRKEAIKRGREALEIVDLIRFKDQFPRQLSGGMKQRVSIARALVMKPRVLLMDEPFGALDQITRDRLNLELLRVWSLSMPTVLFVTHSLREALFLSDRVVTLSPRPGRILQDTIVDLARPRHLSMREEDDFRSYYNSIEVALERALREITEDLEYDSAIDTDGRPLYEADAPICPNAGRSPQEMEVNE